MENEKSKKRSIFLRLYERLKKICSDGSCGCGCGPKKGGER